MLPTDLDKITAPELDALIEAIGQHRALLTPAVNDTPPTDFSATINPAWTLFNGPLGSVLRIRHPGFGWLSFIIPPPERAVMVGYLMAQALAPPAPPPMKVSGKKIKAKRK